MQKPKKHPAFADEDASDVATDDVPVTATFHQTGWRKHMHSLAIDMHVIHTLLPGHLSKKSLIRREYGTKTSHVPAHKHIQKTSPFFGKMVGFGKCSWW